MHKNFRYSATSLGEDKENIIVFSGTVFREIVIWSPFRRFNGSNILHRLQKHEVRSIIFCMLSLLILFLFNFVLFYVFKIGCYIFNHSKQM
jgi:hypothetical protein